MGACDGNSVGDAVEFADVSMELANIKLPKSRAMTATIIFIFNIFSTVKNPFREGPII